MTRAPLLALAALALVCALAPAARAGVSPKIVNGQHASASDFPFQALLYTAGGDPRSTPAAPGGDRICGGVIIDDIHVITAAHCVYDVFRANQASSPGDYAVRVGTDDLDTTPGDTRSVSALSFDPRYDPSTNVHDVAVLTLDSPLTFSSTINKIDILDATAFANLFSSATTLTVSGWGDMTAEPADGSGTPTFSNQLQAVDVPLVNDDTCVSDYAAQGVTVDKTLLFCAGDGSNPNTIPDSCQGDSGGPIVYDTNAPTKLYKLVGLVDSGIGCAQQTFPGIYTRIAEDNVKDFFTPTLPPPAPVQTGTASMTGGNSPGQTLTCDAGGWTPTDANAPTFTYHFFRQGSSTPLAGGSTYTIQQGDLGSRIFCEVKAMNQGGYGFADSGSVLVPIPQVTPPPPPPPPPPAKDTTAPTLRIRHKSCTKTKCTVKVRVRDASPSSGIAKVKATLSFRRRVKCRAKQGRATRTCTKRVRRTLRPKAGSGGTYTIVVTHLTPSTSYVITLIPFDKAGNRPTFSTVTNVRTQPKRPRLF